MVGLPGADASGLADRRKPQDWPSHVSSRKAFLQTTNIRLRDEANGHCSDLSPAKDLQVCAIVIWHGSRYAALSTQNLSAFAD